MGKVYFVRHGETNYNVEKRYCGSTDIELNENGIAQAHMAAKAVKEKNIDIIISSNMIRAKQTADIIGSSIEKEVVIIEGIQERCVGVYEGLTQIEVQEKYPQMWEAKSTRGYDIAPENGETIRDVEERVFSALDKIKSEYYGKQILIVAHGFISRMANKYFNEVNEEEFHAFSMKNCDVAEFKYRDS